MQPRGPCSIAGRLGIGFVPGLVRLVSSPLCVHFMGKPHPVRKPGAELTGGGRRTPGSWSTVAERGDYEGLIAKEEASLYEAGPTRRWLKVKQKGWTVEEDRWQRRISAGA